jgi:hypothetical protein
MVHLILSIIIASSSLIIIKDRNASFSYPAKIEALSIVFSASMFIPARAVDRFSAVLSASARSRVWRNIYYSNS